MPDREEAISHLQIMHTWAEFARERTIPDFFTPEHLKSMEAWTMEAIGMLRQMEPVPPRKWVPKRQTAAEVRGWYCPDCNFSLSRGDKYCHECGRRIKWNA